MVKEILLSWQCALNNISVVVCIVLWSWCQHLFHPQEEETLEGPVAEEEKPDTLPGKECGAAQVSGQPKGLREGQVASSLETHIVPEESAPAGAPQEKSIKEVTEVSPEVKTPSSAREGVSFSGFACVLLQMISPAADQPDAFPVLFHFWVFSWTQNHWQACRAEGVACAGAQWQLGFPPLQLIPGFTLPWYNTLCSQADDAVWAFCPSAPSHLKCLPVTLLIHVYFYLFIFGTAIHMLLFQVAELNFRTQRLKW